MSEALPAATAHAQARGLARLDAWLVDVAPHPAVHGLRRAGVELLWFGLKEARACLFAGLFFAAVWLVPRAGLWGIARYDLLLLIALAIQGGMLVARLETLDEMKAICLFHLVGFALEVFKTSPGIGSWSYPDPAWSKVLGVPLSPASCMRRSAATSSRPGACSTCASATIRRTGWRCRSPA